MADQYLGMEKIAWKSLGMEKENHNESSALGDGELLTESNWAKANICRRRSRRRNLLSILVPNWDTEQREAPMSPSTYDL